MTDEPYYERKGGYFSRGDTIKKIRDHLREAAKGCSIVAHEAKMQDMPIGGGSADQWLKMADKFEQAAELIRQMETTIQ